MDRTKCSSCLCDESVVQSIVKEFTYCLECKSVQSTSLKKVRILTKKFGLGNKTLDQAIERLEELKALVPAGASARLDRDYDSYVLRVDRPENNLELIARMRKAEEVEKRKLEAREKQVLARKKAEDEQRKHMEDVRRKSLEAQKKGDARKAQLKKEKEKIESLFQSHGISFAVLKEILTNEI